MPSSDGDMVRPYECFRDCVRRNEFDDGERASRGCTHPHLPKVEWDIAPERLTAYLGRGELYEQRHDKPHRWLPPDWWKEPPEDLEDGCPAGWILAPFSASLTPYLRRRSEGGGRVSNPRFDDCEDSLIQDAALLYEDHQENLCSHAAKKRLDKMKARMNGRG